MFHLSSRNIHRFLYGSHRIFIPLFKNFPPRKQFELSPRSTPLWSRSSRSPEYCSSPGLEVGSGWRSTSHGPPAGSGSHTAGLVAGGPSRMTCCTVLHGGTKWSLEWNQWRNNLTQRAQTEGRRGCHKWKSRRCGGKVTSTPTETIIKNFYLKDSVLKKKSKQMKWVHDPPPGGTEKILFFWCAVFILT